VIDFICTQDVSNAIFRILITRALTSLTIVGQRHANMESLYDYGARAGFWRLHELLTRKQVPW
jgi:hypothetical protein